MSIRNLVIAFLFLFTLGLSIWMMHEIKITSSFPTPHVSMSSDAYATDIQYQRFDERGKLQNLLTSPHWLHYPHEDTSVFTEPRLTVYQPTKPPWLITAKRGIAKHGNEKIILSGDVNISQSTPEDGKTTLTTSLLTVFPKTHLVETDQLVRLEQPGSVVEATGMKANLKTGNVHLLSNTRGRYEPTAHH